MKISNLLWGLVFIVIGIIFGLNALGFNINIFFDGWWTLFIIIPSLIGLFKDSSKTGSIVGLIIGISFLLASLNIINFAIIWKLLVPVILVIIGLSFIFKDLFNNKIKQEIKKIAKNNNEEYCATFSAQQLDFSGEKFMGGKLLAVFGGIKCDLKDSIIKEDVVIDCSAIFGGITIYVPDNVNVKISSTSIFGGTEDERKHKSKDNKITIYINANALFGGIEIK